MSHWRHYKPGLRSEGADTRSIPYALIFAMAGIEIEAREKHEFPAYLRKSELRHALRFIHLGIEWLPQLAGSNAPRSSQAVMEAIQNELFWELANTKSDQPMYDILHDLAYFAPWLHCCTR